MMLVFYILCIPLFLQNLKVSADDLPLTEKELIKIRNEVKSMFYHAYEGYMKYAIPYDELRPLTCDGHDTWGSYSLTLIDALDTLAVMDNKTEFRRVYELVAERSNFEADINVSVFETNIRIVGGLLSGHLLARRMGLPVGEHWPCKGPLLSLAVDAASRLLPAFDTPTGMPYGTVNLKHGVPTGETPVTCAAGVGTFLIEFGTISRLTGDPLYEEVALRAIHALWQRRSRLNLIGNHIDVLTGHWTGNDAGIGAGVDSYFEYLVKGSFLFQRPELMAMFKEARFAIDKHLKHEDWYLWKSMQRAQVSMAVFQSLEAFWPGILTLAGDIEAAQKTLFNYHQVLKQYGFTPEFYSIPQAAAYSKRSGYPLRPELVESLMYLYQATKDHTFLKMGADLVKAIEHSTRTKCGYATVENVVDHSLENRMESFFLAETTKYLYLLFHEDHWLHSSGNRGHPLKVGNRYCVVDAGGYFFNTEAHPIDAGALTCCSGPEETNTFLAEEDIVNLILDPSLFIETRATSIPINEVSMKISQKKSKEMVKDDELTDDSSEIYSETDSQEKDESNGSPDVEPVVSGVDFEEAEDVESVEANETENVQSVEANEAEDIESVEANETETKNSSEIDEYPTDNEMALKNTLFELDKETELEAEGPTVLKGKPNNLESSVNQKDSLLKVSEFITVEKDRNTSEYEGSASDILKEGDQEQRMPWSPRFSSLGDEHREKEPSIVGVVEVATSVSSSKFSRGNENRIVEKEAETEPKPPPKIFSIDEMRKTVHLDILSIENQTLKSCPSVLSCKVSFSENFHYKGQMIVTP